MPLPGQLIDCILTLQALTCVSLIAVFLVEEIRPIVEMGVPDNFMGLILVPLVEKAAEHLTAVDEAWDNQMVCPQFGLPDLVRLCLDP